MPEPAYEEGSSVGDAPGRTVTTGEPPVRPRRLPLIDVRPEGESVRVTVRGELDLDADDALDRALRAAVTLSAGDVELDLSGVDFCDCSALNVLLTHRRRALDEGKMLVLGGAAPTVLRLMELTGTLTLFVTDDDAGESVSQDDDALEDLRVEVVQLRRAMQTRPVIDLARGILMASFGLSAEDAWTALVTASQNTNTKLHHLARDLVGAVHGEPLADPVQQQLAAAVAKVAAPAPVETPKL
ncbi:ANTAR domain-containing protein [Streptomyces sp. NPDC014006]|uniref:ANTAR domain-containing protein n=1 Tax=Streptomyces sp. NPDC014006 TaxID=3364870 RepID=UPI0036FF646D